MKLICLSLYVGFDRFRGVFLKQRRNLCYIWEMGCCPLAFPPPFPIPFLPVFSHQKSFSFKNSVWVIGVPFWEWFWPWYWLLIACTGRIFSSGRFFVYFNAEILILRRSFSLWGESVSLSELDPERYALNINPQGRSAVAPLHSNIRTTTNTTIQLNSTTEHLTNYLNCKKSLDFKYWKFQKKIWFSKKF